ncbi:unnamed protein product [Amoebophrya sp. A120]|nr:unnamed protein product [Amoebophrya sp. A120]|eukprot:GSA120T00009412001.1
MIPWNPPRGPGQKGFDYLDPRHKAPPLNKDFLWDRELLLQQISQFLKRGEHGNAESAFLKFYHLIQERPAGDLFSAEAQLHLSLTMRVIHEKYAGSPSRTRNLLKECFLEILASGREQHELLQLSGTSSSTSANTATTGPALFGGKQPPLHASINSTSTLPASERFNDRGGTQLHDGGFLDSEKRERVISVGPGGVPQVQKRVGIMQDASGGDHGAGVQQQVVGNNNGSPSSSTTMQQQSPAGTGGDINQQGPQSQSSSAFEQKSGSKSSSPNTPRGAGKSVNIKTSLTTSSRKNAPSSGMQERLNQVNLIVPPAPLFVHPCVADRGQASSVPLFPYKM